MSALNTEALLLGQEGGGGYAIERSLRFNSADSAYLSRTPASAGNRKTWTWAGWVKRSTLVSPSGLQTIFSGRSADTNRTAFWFNDDGTINVLFNHTSGWVGRSVERFRDFSAWFHLVVQIDTTNATASDRIKAWVNNSRLTLSTTSGSLPALNTDGGVNNTITHAIGDDAPPQGYNFNGYLADIHFIDGQALDPTSFGEFDATTGVWVPKAYTGTYGTNGFHLEFADNSSNTATTLGKDTSGNSNNWTPNNLSVTAGAGNDSLVDVPTNGAQTDTGAGGEVRGNYCTLNPLQKGATIGNPTNGNLEITNPSVVVNKILGTIGVSSGKWYWECSRTGGANGMPGIARANTDLATYVGGDANSWGYYNTGVKYNNGTSSSYGASYANNDVISIAFDADNGTLVFYKNGVSQGTAFSGLTSGPYFPAEGDNGSGVWWFNFGQRPFAYTAPSGFKALNTANLPAPVVTKPSEYMDIALYTGNATARSITGLGFSPDFVWIKGRSGSTNHALYDIVRGAQLDLVSNSEAAETTQSTGLTAFNSDGFSIGTLAKLNTNAATYAAWAWDAGSSTVTNTQGSISSQVRANVSAGFSIVTWTADPSLGLTTIGTGLGLEPSFIFLKNRDVSDNWFVYHASRGVDAYLRFTNSVSTSNTGFWSVSSSTFGVKQSSIATVNTQSCVAYCFAPVAGYSAFGSYTGNGSTDGPFVYLGFRPAVVIVKMSSGTGDWTILDSKRAGYNVDNDPLFPNLANAQGTTDLIDITSNGFKVRTTGATFNTNAGTYVFAAWAESPFQFSRAR
jgi:hypothetical protein